MAKVVVILEVINIAQTIEERRILLSIILLFKEHSLFVRFVDELPTRVLLNVKFYGYTIFMSDKVRMSTRLKIVIWFNLTKSQILRDISVMLQRILSQKRAVLAVNHFTVMVLGIVTDVELGLKRMPQFKLS